MDSSSSTVVCTLTTKARVRQQLEWTTLGEVAIASWPVAGGVVVELPIERHDDVADLVAREIDCCGSWLSLDLALDQKRLLLTATAEDEDGEAVIRSMVGLDT